MSDTVNAKMSAEISRFLSYALRHAPWEYELELDEHGWAPLASLTNAMQHERSEWADITPENVSQAITSSDKQRHEIWNGQIRAIYGHSLPIQLQITPAIPPCWLYHGTSPAAIDAIKEVGLQPMTRQYVHLSVDLQTANSVGKRKSQAPIILRIAAQEAHNDGRSFYRGNDKVWLAKCVPSKFVEMDWSPS